MVQDRAHDYEAAIDRGWTRAGGTPGFDERFQCLIVDLLRFEMADVRLEQGNVPSDDIDAALCAGLLDIAPGAIGEGRSRVRLAGEVGRDPRHFRAESLLGLLLCHSADT